MCWNCDTLNGLSNKVCVPNETEDLSLSVFNIMTGINRSKTLPKHMSCKCKYKFDRRKCKSNQKWNNNKGWYECIWNPAMCSCKNGKYLSSIIRNSEITFDETIKEIKTVLTKTVPKKTCSNKKYFNKLLYFIQLFSVFIATW